MVFLIVTGNFACNYETQKHIKNLLNLAANEVQFKGSGYPDALGGAGGE
jgi:hypothetical protein